MRIALDPWGSDYASQLAVLYEVDTEDTSVQALDEEIEERPWAPVTPLPAAVPAVTAVVDGVMRQTYHEFSGVSRRSREAPALPLR